MKKRKPKKAIQAKRTRPTHNPDYRPPVDNEMRLGRPACVEEVDVDFGHEDTPRKHLAGGVKGHKPLTAIFKDQMRNQFERRMKKDFQYVLTAVVDQANEGNMQAAKLLFDRVIPTNKAIDQNQSQKIPLININIRGIDDNQESPDGDVISER